MALFQDELKEIGLDVEIKIFQVAEIFEAIQRGEFDMAGAACPPVVPDPADYMRRCWSVNPDGTPADGNVTKWINDEFNEILSQFEKETDLQKRYRAVHPAERDPGRERPFTGLFYGVINWGWYNHPRGLPAKGGFSGYDVYQWDLVWLDR